MAESDADQSVLIIGYEKPWLDRSAILIDNSFLDALDESTSKGNHGRDHEKLTGECEQELKQLKECHVKSSMSACNPSDTKKSQLSPNQHKHNQRSRKFSRKSSRERQESLLSGSTSSRSEEKRKSKDDQSLSKGEKKSLLENENQQRSTKQHENSRHVQRSSSKKRTGSCAYMGIPRLSRQKVKRRSIDKTQQRRTLKVIQTK